jgi:pimeloyl-ACP methyl ester carboxylesterase
MTERLLEINGVELCVETFGDRADPPILLVAGGSASMLWWDAELCERIAAGGGFGDITAPTLVVHGDRDPFLPLSHGEALRDAIPGAELLVLAGAGHDLPEPVWDVFVPALIRHTGRGRS